jgi:hypothetical protein
MVACPAVCDEKVSGQGLLGLEKVWVSEARASALWLSATLSFA